MRTLLAPLALLLTLGVAGSTAAAHAGEVTVRDRTGDVSETRVGDSVFVVQSSIREGDFVATTFRHGPRNVVVTSRFRDLARVGDHHGYYLRLESGRHVYRDISVEAGPGAWAGRHLVVDRRGHQVRCGVQHTVDYARNLVRIVVPRSCLGSPRVVRGTAAAAWTAPDTQDASQPDHLRVDNPHNDDPQVATWTRWIERG
jgi:hypothetical protein